MALRVGDKDVRELIPNTRIDSLTVFIQAAELLVDKLVASDCGSTLTSAELISVQLYLSAHFAAVSDPKLNMATERFEDATNIYSRGNSKDMTGIMSTQFGQMANTLSDGCLMEIDMRKISITALGGHHYTDLT